MQEVAHSSSSSSPTVATLEPSPLLPPSELQHRTPMAEEQQMDTIEQSLRPEPRPRVSVSPKPLLTDPHFLPSPHTILHTSEDQQHSSSTGASPRLGHINTLSATTNATTAPTVAASINSSTTASARPFTSNFAHRQPQQSLPSSIPAALNSPFRSDFGNIDPRSPNSPSSACISTSSSGQQIDPESYSKFPVHSAFPNTKTASSAMSQDRQSQPQQKRVWIQRLGSSPTSVFVGPNDLVDDLKTLVFKRYPNSLGKHSDPADIVIRLNNGGEEKAPDITTQFSPDDRVFDIIDKLFENGVMTSARSFIIDVPEDDNRESPFLDNTTPLQQSQHARPKFTFPTTLSSNDTGASSISLSSECRPQTNKTSHASNASIISTSPSHANPPSSLSTPSSAFTSQALEDPLTAVAVVNQQQLEENQRLQDKLQNGANHQPFSNRHNSIMSIESVGSINKSSSSLTNTPTNNNVATTSSKPSLSDEVKRVVEKSISLAEKEDTANFASPDGVKKQDLSTDANVSTPSLQPEDVLDLSFGAGIPTATGSAFSLQVETPDSTSTSFHEVIADATGLAQDTISFPGSSASSIPTPSPSSAVSTLPVVPVPNVPSVSTMSTITTASPNSSNITTGNTTSTFRPSHHQANSSVSTTSILGEATPSSLENVTSNQSQSPELTLSNQSSKLTGLQSKSDENNSSTDHFNASTSSFNIQLQATVATADSVLKSSFPSSFCSTVLPTDVEETKNTHNQQGNANTPLLHRSNKQGGVILLPNKNKASMNSAQAIAARKASTIGGTSSLDHLLKEDRHDHHNHRVHNQHIQHQHQKYTTGGTGSQNTRTNGGSNAPHHTSTQIHSALTRNRSSSKGKDPKRSITTAFNGSTSSSAVRSPNSSPSLSAVDQHNTSSSPTSSKRTPKSNSNSTTSIPSPTSRPQGSTSGISRTPSFVSQKKSSLPGSVNRSKSRSISQILQPQIPNNQNIQQQASQQAQKQQDVLARKNLLASKLLSPYTAVVPQVNVLIVEDNVINMRILERYLRQRSIRSDWAENGRKAIEKWRQGGFHLVLMDIQMPELSGLEATKEIRRLEQVNRIGVFSTEEDADSNSTSSSTSGVASTASSSIASSPGISGIDDTSRDELKDGHESNNDTKKNAIAPEDVLDTKVFKFPVIIVALTASSALADKTEALAAGCNDYLVKPVNLKWLWRKTIEWGCMQALIDFEGWKHWVSKAPPSITAANTGALKGPSGSTSGGANGSSLSKDSKQNNSTVNGSGTGAFTKERPPPLPISKSNHRNILSSPSMAPISNFLPSSATSATFSPSDVVNVAHAAQSPSPVGQSPSSTLSTPSVSSLTYQLQLQQQQQQQQQQQRAHSRQLSPKGRQGHDSSSDSLARSKSFTRSKRDVKTSSSSASRLSKMMGQQTSLTTSVTSSLASNLASGTMNSPGEDSANPMARTVSPNQALPSSSLFSPSGSFLVGVPSSGVHIPGSPGTPPFKGIHSRLVTSPKSLPRTHTYHGSHLAQTSGGSQATGSSGRLASTNTSSSESALSSKAKAVATQEHGLQSEGRSPGQSGSRSVSLGSLMRKNHHNVPGGSTSPSPSLVPTNTTGSNTSPSSSLSSLTLSTTQATGSNVGDKSEHADVGKE